MLQYFNCKRPIFEQLHLFTIVNWRVFLVELVSTSINASRLKKDSKRCGNFLRIG